MGHRWSSWKIVGGAVSGLAIVSLLVLLAVFIPPWIASDIRDPTQQDTLELEYRKIILQIIPWVTILVGLWLTYRRIKATEEQVAIAQKGQIAERYTKAIEQLDTSDKEEKEHLYIRLGGIYALENIAQEFPEAYHWAVMEVLCAYLRGLPTPEYFQEEENIEVVDLDEKRKKVPEDVRAILKVLSRRRTEHETQEHYFALQEAHLEFTDMCRIALRRAGLSAAHLKGARLNAAQLQEADLTGASLQLANLQDADLQGADLGGANAKQVILKNSDLRGATLSGCFEYASLTEARVAGADFTLACLNNANLSGIEGWQEIAAINGANIYGVRNAPAGFREWALKRGAVEREPSRGTAVRVIE